MKPAQLPPDVAGFTGRITEMSRLDQLLSDGQAQRTVVVPAVTGTAGVGKTALAVHWAHQVRDKFADGQLYVNLRGYAPDGPTPALDALGGFLRALGVAGESVPPELDGATVRYRDLLADRRVLVVLDNAASAEQVRPLLPPGPGSLALVTSRDELAGLVARDGAHRITLGALTPGEARTLLVRTLGGHRVAPDPGAAAELARLCAYLPLALRIAAANIPDDEPVAAYAARLRDGNRLASLAVDDDEQAAVRAAFDLSYAVLPDGARRLFRLLGLAPGPHVTVDAAASLAGAGRHATRRLLRQLTAAHLIEHRSGRYGFHDLLRLYAAELAHRDDPAQERRAALRRVLDHYRTTAQTAGGQVNARRGTRRAELVTAPGPGVTVTDIADQEQAFAWFTAEHATLLAAVQVAGAGFDEHVWELAAAMQDFLHRRGHWQDLMATQHAAADAGRRRGELRVQADAQRALALADSRLGRLDDFDRHLRRALELDVALGEPAGHPFTHINLASLRGRQGRYADALAHAQQALDLYRAAGSELGQANALNSVGWYHAALGEYRQALGCCTEALRLQEQLGDQVAQAHTWDSLGHIHHKLGDDGESIACYQHSVDRYRDLGDRYHEAVGLARLAGVLAAAGDPDAAGAARRQALAILDDLRHPQADVVRAGLPI